MLLVEIYLFCWLNLLQYCSRNKSSVELSRIGTGIEEIRPGGP